jgi:hypothetical protein
MSATVFESLKTAFVEPEATFAWNVLHRLCTCL